MRHVIYLIALVGIIVVVVLLAITSPTVKKVVASPEVMKVVADPEVMKVVASPEDSEVIQFKGELRDLLMWQTDVVDRTPSRVAIGVPLHRPKWNDAIRLMDTCRDNKAFHLYFIFLTSEEGRQFQDIVPLDAPVAIVALDRVYSNFEPFMTSIVTTKKLAFVYSLMDGPYDFIIMFDAETRCIGTAPWGRFESELDKFESGKVWHGSVTPETGFQDITRLSAKRLEPALADQVGDKTCNFSVYPWFHDLPIYFKSYLPDFFSKLLLTPKFEYNQFDHLVFQCYTLTARGWSLAPLSMNPILEINQDPENMRKLHHNPLWLNAGMQRVCNSADVFFEFHVDRF